MIHGETNILEKCLTKRINVNIDQPSTDSDSNVCDAIFTSGNNKTTCLTLTWKGVVWQRFVWMRSFWSHTLYSEA